MDLHSTQPLASNSALPVSDSVRCGKSGKRGGGVAVTNHSYANFNIWHGLHPHPAKPAAAGAYGNATRSPFMIWARLAVSTSDRPHRMLKYYVESREKGEKCHSPFLSSSLHFSIGDFPTRYLRYQMDLVMGKVTLCAGRSNE